jgi:hypothetical protein
MDRAMDHSSSARDALGVDAYTTALRIVNWLDVVHASEATRLRLARPSDGEPYLQAARSESEIEWYLLGASPQGCEALVLAGAVSRRSRGAPAGGDEIPARDAPAGASRWRTSSPVRHITRWRSRTS